MQDFAESFSIAFSLVARLDPDLLEIVLLSLRVSLSAVAIAVIIGLPLGAALGVSRFRGRQTVIVIVNALLGLPPVVIGLLVYLALSNAGPFGWMRLLYSPTAMIIAQTILITPIITALTREIVEQLHDEYAEYFRSLCISRRRALAAYLWDARFSLLTVGLAGFGRAIAEVGAVIVVGGNIDHLTRVMTTAIALETSKGDLALALALGIVLMVIALSVNALVMMMRGTASRTAFA
jgi:tungstate transport system permease protein